MGTTTPRNTSLCACSGSVRRAPPCRLPRRALCSTAVMPVTVRLSRESEPLWAVSAAASLASQGRWAPSTSPRTPSTRPRPGEWPSVSPRLTAAGFPDPTVRRECVSPLRVRGHDVRGGPTCQPHSRPLGPQALSLRKQELVAAAPQTVGLTRLQTERPGMRSAWERGERGRWGQVPQVTWWKLLAAPGRHGRAAVTFPSAPAPPHMRAGISTHARIKAHVHTHVCAACPRVSVGSGINTDTTYKVHAVQTDRTPPRVEVWPQTRSRVHVKRHPHT